MSKLRIQGVSRVFPGVHGGPPVRALEPVDLDVADNDFITILGPSGCGKSTLLRIVAGLSQPSTGQVLLDGHAVTRPGPDRGMVFQSYTLFPWLTVRDNICFGLREKGMPKAQQAERADFFIDRVGLRGFENHYPKMLSGGMQQRTAIARAGRVAVMTARPGRIKCEAPLDLPHPRHYTIKTAPAFSALKARLTEEIRVEALRASDAAA